MSCLKPLNQVQQCRLRHLAGQLALLVHRDEGDDLEEGGVAPGLVILIIRMSPSTLLRRVLPCSRRSRSSSRPSPRRGDGEGDDGLQQRSGHDKTVTKCDISEGYWNLCAVRN